MTANETVTAVISTECQRRHLTRAQLANTLGWGRDQVTRKLNGERRWTLEDLDQVSTALGLPLPVLLMAPAAIVTEGYRSALVIVTRWYRSSQAADLSLSNVADFVSSCSLSLVSRRYFYSSPGWPWSSSPAARACPTRRPLWAA